MCPIASMNWVISSGKSHSGFLTNMTDHMVQLDLFSTVFNDLVLSGKLVPKPDIVPPSVPMDYDWARV